METKGFHVATSIYCVLYSPIWENKAHKVKLIEMRLSNLTITPYNPFFSH
jgi:hypothetical protein